MKYIYLFNLFFLTTVFTNAQCIPDGSITTPGVIAPISSVDCIDRGVAFDDVIQFRNFNQIVFGGNLLTLDQMRIDSVNNLPCGIDWELSNPNSIYANSEQGCIRLLGTTNDSVGQYKLKIWASIDVGAGFFGPLDANNFNLLTFYVRVKNSADTCPAIDTTAFEHTSDCNSLYYSIKAESSEDSICINGTTTLTTSKVEGSGSYSYAWAPSPDLSCLDCSMPTFTPSDTGLHSFVVTVIDSISEKSDTDTVQVYVNACASISSLGYENISIYPNPSAGELVVNHDFETTGIVEHSLINMQGQQVKYSVNSIGNKLKLKMDEPKSGIYFLTLSNGQRLYRAKIVVR